MRNHTCLCLLLLSGFFLPTVAEAQRERRRQFVEGLLEGLIESQLDNLTDNNRQPLPRTASIPAEVANAREELQHISASFRNLVNVLQHESYAAPGYRQPLAEAMHIKASCDALYHSSANTVDLRSLAQGYSPVDQQWRSLSHRLKQARGVNQSVLAIVDEVNNHTDEMGQLLSLKPQLDRTELIRLSSTLTTEFRHLLDDISYEMRGSSQQAALLQQGRELLARIRQSMALLDRGDYDTLVQAWQQGQSGWRPYANELRRSGTERVRRDVMRIEQTGRQITAALWLPIPVDREYLAHVVASFELEFNHIVESISLKDMMQCPDPQRLLGTTAELQNAISRFAGSIGNSGAMDDLVWDYRILHVSWSELASQCRAMNNPPLIRHLESAAESMRLLEQSLGAGLQPGQEEILQMVSELGELCNQTAIFVNQNIAPAEHYDFRLKSNVQQRIGGVQNAVRSVHSNLTRQQANGMIQEDLTTAMTHWNQLKLLMGQCHERDQQVFRQLRGQMEPLFVKLQVVYLR